MSRVENALMRLYEDADLRDELTDDEAETLLKWAETRLTQLDTPALDDETFETQVDTFMRLVKQMNRYAGRQGQASAQDADETPGKIAALAVSLGHATAADRIAAAATGEPASTVAALTALLSPAAAPPPEMPVQPQATPPEQPEQPPQDTHTEPMETTTDDDPTAEAGTPTGASDRAGAADGWLYPDADADPHPDEYTAPNQYADPADGDAG